MIRLFSELRLASTNPRTRDWLNEPVHLHMEADIPDDAFAKHAQDVAAQLMAMPKGFRSLYPTQAMQVCMDPKFAADFGLPAPDPVADKRRGTYHPDSIAWTIARIKMLVTAYRSDPIDHCYFDSSESSKDAAVHARSIRKVVNDSGLRGKCQVIIDPDCVAVIPGDKDENGAASTLDCRLDRSASCPWLGLAIGGDAAAMPTLPQRQLATIIGHLNRLLLRWPGPVIPGICASPFNPADWPGDSYAVGMNALLGHASRILGKDATFHVYNPSGTPEPEDSIAAIVAKHYRFADRPLSLPQIQLDASEIVTGGFRTGIEEFATAA